jgi:hypothetical protein
MFERRLNGLENKNVLKIDIGSPLPLDARALKWLLSTIKNHF